MIGTGENKNMKCWRTKGGRALLCLCAVLFTMGCSTQNSGSKEMQDTQQIFNELMDEVNQRHESVVRRDMDYSKWLRKTEAEPSYQLESAETVQFDPQLSMTIQEAEADVDFLFNYYRNNYGLYDYFGGDEAFFAAKERVLKDCREEENLTCKVLEQSLLENLAFVKDGHFLINRQSGAKMKYPFFYREIAFIKDGEGYCTEDGRKVESIKGYEQWQDLLKLSISEEGNLVYYPVLLKECGSFSIEYEDLRFRCDEQLQVQFADGSIQALNAEPYAMYYDNPENEIARLDEYGEAPVMKLHQCTQMGSRELNSYIEKIKEEPVAVLDLRSNGGGRMTTPMSLLQRLAGRVVPFNTAVVNPWDGVETAGRPDEFIPRSNLLIILVGKYTASAAEGLVDMAHNLENTLLIGENTSGSYLESVWKKQLPNSHILVLCGVSTIKIPADYGEYYEELRGFYPDIWVPAKEAEEAAMQFVKKYAAGGSEQGKGPTVRQTMDEINKAHENVVQFHGDYMQYMPVGRRGVSHLREYPYDPEVKFQGEELLTMEQAEEDVKVLFDGFRVDYSKYFYLGGEEAFDKAEADILTECRATDGLTCQVFEDILSNKLSFIKDGHFSINRKVPSGVTIPFFFREVEFIKTDDGYETADGKKVVSVDGYPDCSSLPHSEHTAYPDSLFRRSLNKKGEIVYYPIVFEKRERLASMAEEQFCSYELTIHFSDGSVNILVAEPYRIYADRSEEYISVTERDGIPIVATECFVYDKGGNEFVNTGSALKEEPAVILDLRVNPGGNSDIGSDWLKQYAGVEVPSNSLLGHYETRQIVYGQPDQFVPHDTLLVLLTGKFTASAAELFIDMTYNLENTVLIGENTMGCMLGGTVVRIQLPNSKILAALSTNIVFPPEDPNYFEELRGFYPDFWVPAGEAQDAAIQFIKKMKEQS